MFNSNTWPNSAPLRDIRLRNCSDHEFDLSRAPLDSLCIVSYCLIVIYGLIRLLFKIIDFEMSLTLTFTLKGHSRSNVMVLLDFPYMNSYSCVIVTTCLPFVVQLL